MQGRARTGLVLASYLLFSLSNVHANPTGHEVISGSADFHMPSTEQLHITAGDQTIINWQQFSINTSELTKFIQPSATSSVLNRVTGSNLSELLGTLEANGKVFLINPQGVLVGSSAVIDTASFTATTFDISDAAFLAGEEILFKGDSAGKIINYGLIKASSGDVLLLGRFVENHGTIEAKEGLVALAAGQEILLKPTDEEKIFIRPSHASLGTTGLDQKGLITALQVELKADGSAYSMAINHQGSIKALRRDEIDGKVFLTVYSGGSLSQEGTILAPEGSITISNTLENPLQERKGLSVNLGTLDVSGVSGGKISITTDSYLGAGHLKADGSSGSGGQININATLGIIETSLGSLSANGSSGGKIFASAPRGTLFSSAKREATGSSGIGGEVHMLGSQVTLAAASIDASGSTGGGTVLIGGDFQGSNPAIMNATATYVNEATKIHVDALASGNGGKAVVWADDKTEFYGSISAKAGQAFGNGGMIEISGKETLHYVGSVNASSPEGIPGSVLFDPKNIVVDAVTGIYPQFSLVDPSSLGSGFGATIVSLGNGNVVVTKPNDGATSNVGAAYLYNGYTGALISTLTGSAAGDLVGSTGVVTLTNGNYVIRSASWSGGTGAATWGDGLTGVSGIVSALNSLVGTATSHAVSSDGVTALTNGNYVVRSSFWDNGSVSNAGAATWGNGTTGITGTVSVSNSLVGTTTDNFVSFDGVTALTNGNYVVRSSFWDNLPAVDVGAATWGNGTTGITGTVSVSNSLIGTISGNSVSSDGVTALSNGNYVVRSGFWDNGSVSNAGAATWGNGTTGVTGTVSVSNSLVGTTLDNFVSFDGVITLANGNYVVQSSFWDDGLTSNVGAVTWGNGGTGITGTVSGSNSLIGTTANDRVGFLGMALTNNNNYVVQTSSWDNGIITDVGAVTWGNGGTGITGTVSISNSLIGTTPSDNIGSGGITTLTNGNYVVRSALWDNGIAIQAGAATWGNGTTGITGTVSISNSLVGSASNHSVSTDGVTALTNGNYVVRSSFWDNGSVSNAGAATWGNGTTGITGTVSVSNSLVGTTTDNFVSFDGVTALTNGNYVVRSSFWDNGSVSNAGAATWGNGTTGITGTVSISNSLIGGTSGNFVSFDGITALTNGNYVVQSSFWDNGGAADAGAATWGNGTTGITGTVSASNSLIGIAPSDHVSSAGITVLSNGYYLISSPLWNNGSFADAGATTPALATAGITGTISAINSLAGMVASSGMGTPTDDTSANGSFLVQFATESPSRVAVGLFDPNQLTFPRGEYSTTSGTMTVHPSLLTTTLNTGTAVTLQASNDITISNPITANNLAGSGGNLTLDAGRTLAINASITTDGGSLTLIANELLSAGVVDAFRDAGNATLTLGANAALDAVTGNITLNLLDGAGKTNSGAGDLFLGANSSIQTSGSGIININSINNIQLAANTLIQSTAGVLQMIAGNSLIAAGATTIQTTTGNLILVVDNDFPTSPLFGTGAVNFPLAMLSTSGGKLVIFTVERSLNTQPAVINGVPYVPGPEFFDSPTEQWGVYYPHFSGIPFTIFYKTGIPAATMAVMEAKARLFFDIAISEYPQWLSLNDQLFLTDPAYFFSVNNWDPLSSRIPFKVQDRAKAKEFFYFLQKEPFRMHTRGPIDQ